MMKHLFLSLSIFLTAFAANAQKSLLWEISGNGLGKPSYVYGTIHAICPNDYFMTDSTKKAVQQSEQVYMELDMDDPKMTMEAQKVMFMTDGKKITDFMSADDYTLVNDYVKSKLGFPLDMMKTIKPFGLYSMIMLSGLECKMPKQYEMEFVTLAHQQKLEVFGLETMAFQMSLFEKIPNEKLCKMMVEDIKKGNDGKAEFSKLVAAYKSQDLEQMLKIADESSSEMKDIETELLDKRNTTWIPTIETAMKAKATFFAVGAAHLGGKKGVLKLLKDKGYKVRAIL